MTIEPSVNSPASVTLSCDAPLHISRSEAIAAGANKYYREKPCVNGHVGVAWVHGGCIQCRTEKQEKKTADLARDKVEQAREDLRSLVVSRTRAVEESLPRYFTGLPCKKGHYAERHTKSRECVECGAAYQATSRERDPEGRRLIIYKYRSTNKWAETKAAYTSDPKNQERRRELAKSGRIRNLESHLLKSAKARARKIGLPFDLEHSDIIIPDVCPILGIPLGVKDGKGPGDNSPSLDRIDNDKGYVKGNVHVISHRANRIKSDANLQELKLILDYLEGLVTCH